MESREFEIVVHEDIFPGFYNTVYDPNEELEEGSTTDDYTYYVESITDNVIELVKDSLPEIFNVTGGRLISPKQYNYVNDCVVVTIQASHEEIVKKYLSDVDIMQKYLILDDWDDIFEGMLDLIIYMKVLNRNINIEEYLKDIY